MDLANTLTRFIWDLGPESRRELLLVLTSPSDVRADAIAQFHQRPGGEYLAELLIELEEKEWARQSVIEELRSFP